MNKWYFISIGSVALIAIGFVKFVLPNLGLLELGQNLASGDPERIAQAIDFESLRKSLLTQYQANKKRSDASKKPGKDNDEDANSAEESDLSESADATNLNENSDAGDGQSPQGQDSGQVDQAQEKISLPVPVETSGLSNVLDPLISADKRQDARVQAMLNDALSADGINRLLNGEMTQYNDLAREIFPPHLVDMAMNMSPGDVRSLLKNVRTTAGPDGTQIMSVDMPNKGGEMRVTMRQNGSSYQIVDLQVPK